MPIRKSKSAGSGAAAFDPTTTVRFFDDFLSGWYAGSGQLIGDQTTWASVQTGSPTLVVNSGTIIPSTAANPGIVELGTSTDAAYGAGITTGAYNTATFPGFVIGGGQITFEALLKISAISDGTNNAQINAGFRDGPGWSAAANACNIQFQREASNNWQLLVTASSTQTALDSGIAATSGWHHLKIVIDAAGANVMGFVDGVSMGAAVTTNIPVVALPPMITIRKTLGTSARYLGIDYVKIDKTLSSAR